MIDAIVKEISNFADVNRKIIETIYFGGGTPSLLSERELTEIVYAVQKKFLVSEIAEVTLEANPDDINGINLSLWKKVGINRLSVGIQSFSDAELKWMNRAHSADQSMEALEAIRAAGFTNFSADLIYGSPFLSNEELAKSVSILNRYEVPHVSAYALTVEPKTSLYHQIKKNQSLPVDPDKQALQYEILVQALSESGFENYEISNFAQVGYRCLHNTAYWLGLPYYGFGPSAHSFDGINTRRWNIANNALYIKSMMHNLPAYEEDILTPVQQLNEYIMISLRTIEGISLQVLNDKFGEEELQRVMNDAEKYFDEGLLEKNKLSIYLSKKGKFLADGIAADLFK